MKALICPISTARINEYTGRLTGGVMAALLAVYGLTGNRTFVLTSLLDYSLRAWTPIRYSPASWLATQVVRRTPLPEIPIDKAPKIFAARVGFLFALTSIVVSFRSFRASRGVAFMLMSFALLESVGNVCVGCLVYTHLVLPWATRRPEGRTE